MTKEKQEQLREEYRKKKGFKFAINPDSGELHKTLIEIWNNQVDDDFKWFLTQLEEVEREAYERGKESVHQAWDAAEEISSITSQTI